MAVFDQSLCALLAGTSASEDATRVATRAPLVHFPARQPLSEWSGWGSISSPRAREQRPASEDPLDVDCCNYAYFYVGVSCYRVSPRDAHGDSLMLVANDALDESKGFASPFDTGAWLRQPPLLQPNQDVADEKDKRERARLLRENMSVELDRWRVVFGQWLSRCYDDRAATYLDATDDRYQDGEPARTVPPELREENGTRGKEKHPPPPGAKPTHFNCCDRRAWTWELRTEDAVPFDKITHVVGMRSKYQKLVEFCAAHTGSGGRAIEVVFADDKQRVSAEQALYLACAQKAQSLVTT